MSDRETLEELVENDLIEDLTEVYKSCASDKIKEMYESYGEELLASGTFDGKLYALPETAIDDGQQLLWLRHELDGADGTERTEDTGRGFFSDPCVSGKPDGCRGW